MSFFFWHCFSSVLVSSWGAQLNWVWVFVRISSSQMVQRQEILIQGVSVLQKEAVAAVLAVWLATGAGNPSSLSTGHNPTLRYVPLQSTCQPGELCRDRVRVCNMVSAFSSNSPHLLVTNWTSEESLPPTKGIKVVSSSRQGSGAHIQAEWSVSSVLWILAFDVWCTVV